MTAQAPAHIGEGSYGTSRCYDTIDPATEKVIATVADCSASDADAAVTAADAAAPAWAALSLEQRCRALRHAAERLAERRDELIDLAIADTGARLPVAASTQVGAAISRLAEWADRPAGSMEMPDPAAGPGVHSTVRRMPVGVVGCISPYNFPLLAMVGKAAPALFAGNTVVLKPAPQDPLLVIALTEALRDGVRSVGAPSGVVNLVTGTSAETGAAIVRNPAVAAVSFTGSTAVGRQISQDAASSMKRLLLELGGKGAVIVRADVDVRQVAAAVARTWTIQSGQVCLTPARLIVDEAVYGDLIAALGEILWSLRMGDPRDPAVTVGPLISAQQRERVNTLVASARDEGCRVVQDTAVPGIGYYVAPALVLDCEPRNTIMREEVFGPVLSVMRTRSDEEAITAANDTRYGLYDYIFSADTRRAREMAGQLKSAQVGVNTTTRNLAAPFGGNKESGFGRTGGQYSLDLCTTISTITEPDGGQANDR